MVTMGIAPIHNDKRRQLCPNSLVQKFKLVSQLLRTQATRQTNLDPEIGRHCQIVPEIFRTSFKMTHEAEYAKAKAMVEQVHMGVLNHLGLLQSVLPICDEFILYEKE